MAFDWPLLDRGTPFQDKGWEAITRIPVEQTRPYSKLAQEIEQNPHAAQAVGQACAACPFPLLIPTHRVGDAQGIGGFARHKAQADEDCWRQIKRQLLRHEGGGGYDHLYTPSENATSFLID